MKNKSILMTTVALGLLCGGAVRSQAQVAAYQAAVLAEPSLVSYYEFDSGSGVDYYGIRNLVESFTSGPVYTPAVYTTGLGGGLALTQDGSYNGVPYTYPWAYPGGVNPADFTNGQGTVELWVKPGWAGSNAGTSPSGVNLPIIFSDVYVNPRYSVGMLPGRSQIILLDGVNGAEYFNLPTPPGNEWHHLAVTFNATNATVIWDGQSLGTQVCPLGSMAGGPQVLTLGNYTFNNTYAYLPWIGQLDEVAVYSTNLSLASIQAHYGAALAAFPPVILTQPSPTNNWYVGQRRSLAIEVDPAYQPQYQWYKGIGLLSNQTNSVLSVSNVVLGDAGTFTCVVTNISGSVTSSPAVVVVWPTPPTNAMSAYKTAVFAETSLISYYSFDASNAIDDFGGNNGALWYDFGFGTGAGGGSDQALDLVGNGYDRLGTVRAFDFVGGIGTVEMWVQAGWDTSGFGDYPTIAMNWGGNFATWGFCMAPGKTNIVCFDGGPLWSPIDLPTAAGTNWHHMAAVFNADNTWTLFWDGVNVGTNTLAARTAYHGGETLLGSPLLSGGFSIVPPWTGKLDEVAFYSAALTGNQIRNHLGIVASPVINLAKSGNNIVLSWTEAGNWVLESSATVPVVSWTPVQTNGSPATIPISGGNEFFRLRSQ